MRATVFIIGHHSTLYTSTLWRFVLACSPPGQSSPCKFWLYKSCSPRHRIIKKAWFEIWYFPFWHIFYRRKYYPVCTHHDVVISFVDTPEIMNRSRRQEALRYLVSLLPVANRDTLWTLLCFLSVVAQHSKDTRDEQGTVVRHGMIGLAYVSFTK